MGKGNHKENQTFNNCARKVLLKKCRSHVSNLHPCCATTGFVFKSRRTLPSNQACPLAQTWPLKQQCAHNNEEFNILAGGKKSQCVCARVCETGERDRGQRHRQRGDGMMVLTPWYVLIFRINTSVFRTLFIFSLVSDWQDSNNRN